MNESDKAKQEFHNRMLHDLPGIIREMTTLLTILPTMVEYANSQTPRATHEDEYRERMVLVSMLIDTIDFTIKELKTIYDNKH